MIAHVDADSFFASVLMRKDPSLRGKPLLALGMGGGCVIAASYEAKALGVKTGMRMRDALQLAPGALAIPSDFAETGLASEQIETVLRGFCPRVEQMSIDEWFLDLATLVGGVPADLPALGTEVKRDVERATGLSLSVGIAPSKILAKMASEYRKPGGVTVIMTPRRGISIENFLRDRPAAAIPGIGPRRMAHCASRGWTTAWDVAQASPHDLKELFGRPGVELQRELRGEAVSPVRERTEPQQSISRARSFPAERRREAVWAHLLRHVEYVVLKMRRHGLACRGLSVWLRDGTYAYRSTHCSLPRPMETEDSLRPLVLRCFGDLFRRGEACTQVGLCLWKLCPGGKQQLSLFEDPSHALREERLQETMDELHERYGRSALTRASALRAASGTKKRLGLPIYE